MKTLVVGLTICTATVLLWATDLPYFAGEFWAHLYAAPRDQADPERAVYQDAIERIVEESRKIFAGMIFGYEFSYVPGDRTRAVEEAVDIVPVAAELSGDMRVFEHKTEDSVLYAQMRYLPSEAELSRKAAWNDAIRHPASGSGKKERRDEAFEEALRVLIREHLRSLTASKPRRGSGLLVLREVPRVSFSGGLYRYDVSADLYAVTYDSYELY